MSNDLNSFLFSTPEMTRVFSSLEQLQAMMRFEWALTCALEKQGIAAPGSGAVLERHLDAAFVDTVALKRDAQQNGNIAIPFVQQLTVTIEAENEVAARAIHLGATSQDVIDSALVLSLRNGLKLIVEAVARLDQALTVQVRKHARTVLAGRTWLQAAPPTTLGLKLAATLAALRRNRDRIHAAAKSVLVLQFGGAVGTLSALGTAGGSVSHELAQLLDLTEPDLPWHTQRDRLVEIVQVLATLTGTLAKFARDIALLMQTEVSEVAECRVDGAGGSSTMPHKQNPVACAAVVAIHAKMPGLVATMLHSMQQEHERGLGLWQAEWETVPEAFRLAAAALAYSTELTEGLTVNSERMLQNLEGMLGLPLSEAVNTALASQVGRARAHELLRAATLRAVKEKWQLSEILKEIPEVNARLSSAEIDRLFDPRNYLGSAQRFTARVLGDPDADC